MSAIGKLLFMIVLNIGALVLLIYKLVKTGNKYGEALRITWEWIILRAGMNLSGNPNPPTSGLMILGKTWWLMLLVFCIIWTDNPDFIYTALLLFLLLIHFYWFLEGYASRLERFNRILNLNHHWGIIYKEIEEGSGLDSKTLAELDLRKKNLLVLAIERHGQITPFPKGLEVLDAGDRLVMFGDLYSYHNIFGNENGNWKAIENS